MPTARTRIAIGLISLAVIGLELALMRVLSVRFWHHFASMVISVALLGFGASGTAIALLRRRILAHHRICLSFLCVLFSLAVAATFTISQEVPLTVQFLAWDLWSQTLNLVIIELLMFLPFFFAGTMVGAALLDRPERISGHYAANLIGSGVGAIVSILLMHVISTSWLLMSMGLIGYLAGAILLPRRRVPVIAAAIIGVAVVMLMLLMPDQPVMSEHKMLSQLKLMGGTEVICQTEGPLGRIDVVAGPVVHHAPGLSLQYGDPLPSHVLLIVDGDGTSAVYDCGRRDDWAFLDHTTAALPHHVSVGTQVLIIGAGGGGHIGLALFHNSSEIVALEMNQQIIDLMEGPLEDRGGFVYNAPGVTVINQEARGYLATAVAKYDVIDLPIIDAFGASGSGLHAAQESYLHTVESFSALLGCLSDNGVLCITRWARTPPREGLKAFDTAAEALRGRGLEPSSRLAMIRSWATVTVLASNEPFTAGQRDSVRTFCKERGFDLCYLPGMKEEESNRFHVLDRPYYFLVARELLGQQRDDYLKNYVFHLRAPTDDKPYFPHFFRWRALPVLIGQLRGQSPAFLELGYLMLVGAFGQSVLVGVLVILVPLVPGIKAIKHAKGKISALFYFLFLGLGFMLLEVAFLQRLILYLAHPIYSAAVVISSFLIFGGVGSRLSHVWRQTKGMIGVVAMGIVCVALLYVVGLDRWLLMSQGWPMLGRFVIAAATIAPLALGMGHMFPTGLRRVGAVAPALVPWAWAVNGFASVSATVAAPMLAMSIGFGRLTLSAVACYAAAGAICFLLPGDGNILSVGESQ